MMGERVMVGRLLRFLRRRPRLRPVRGLVLARSTAFPCRSCGMLLGSVAQRRGVCPKCRLRVPDLHTEGSRTAE